MARRRRDLANVEAEIVEARIKLADGYWPGAHYWRGSIALSERRAEELRDSISEALRP